MNGFSNTIESSELSKIHLSWHKHEISAYLFSIVNVTEAGYPIKSGVKTGIGILLVKGVEATVLKVKSCTISLTFEANFFIES